MNAIVDHNWFTERIGAYLAGGLEGDELAGFESHRAACAACAAELANLQSADAAIRSVFAGAVPAAGFDDRIAAGRWQNTSPTLFHRFGARMTTLATTSLSLRRMIPSSPHPLVRRAAAAVAAALLLGAIGFVGSNAMHKPRALATGISKTDNVLLGLLGGWDASDGPTTQPAGMEYADNYKSADGYEGRVVSASGKKAAAEYFKKLTDNQIVAWKDALVEADTDKKEAEARTLNGDVSGRLGDSHRSDVLAYGLAGKGGSSPAARGFVTGGDVGVMDGSLLKSSGYPRTIAVTAGGLGLGTEFEKDAEEKKIQEHTKLARVNGAGNADAQPASGEKHASTLDTPTTLAPQDRPVAINTPALGDQSRSSSNTGIGLSSGAIMPKTADFRTQGLTVATPSLYPGQSGLKNPPLSGSGELGRIEDTKTGPVAANTPTLGEQSLSSSNTLPVHRPVEVKNQDALKADLGEPPQSESGNLGTLVASTPTIVSGAVLTPAAPAADAAPKPDAKPTPEQQAAIEHNVQAATQAAAQFARKIIRQGEMQFEVDSFDSCAMQIGKIVAEEGGFIATTDSDKLPNGKVKGTIVLRVPPDHLDVLVLKLRGLGDLKNQRIAAQDVTKQYTDTESELRAARAMEERLLDLIKNGKGQVKDLIAAEKELGTWREKIEKQEGELRYMQNLISLSTLTVTLFERDIKTPTAAFDSETVNTGIETEDVEKARSDALKAIDDAKGRVIQSALKRYDAGRIDATIVAEVAPEAAGPVIDRLKQLGRVSRLDIDRKQVTEGGSGAPTVKVEHRPTRLDISLYNLANIQPRESVSVNIACLNVDAAYKAILAAVHPADEKGGPGGRVLSNSINTQRADQTTATIMLEVPAEQAAGMEQVIRGGNDVMKLTTTVNADVEHSTISKRGFVVQLVSLAQVPARQTITIEVAAKDVPGLYHELLSALTDPKSAGGPGGRIINNTLAEQDRQNVTGSLDFEVPVTAEKAITALLDRAGQSDVISRNVNRAADNDNSVESKLRMSLTLVNAQRLAPRETTTAALDLEKVEQAVNDLAITAESLKGLVVDRQVSKDPSGRSTARLTLDVPLASAPSMLDRIRGQGTLRAIESTRDQRIPDSSLAKARFNVTLASAGELVSPDDSLFATVRKGLRTSVEGLLMSLQWILVGLCLVVPWALVLWGGWKFIRRGKKGVKAPAARP